jgi:hypothetical protein
MSKVFARAVGLSVLFVVFSSCAPDRAPAGVDLRPAIPGSDRDGQASPSPTRPAYPIKPPAQNVRDLQQAMEVTCYHDGESCPGGCDSHVVFKPAHNSRALERRNAYRPGTRLDPEPCRNGEECTFCFSPDPDDCVDTVFRGDGPPVGKVDVTPDFLHENCFYPGTLDPRRSIPEGLKGICSYVRASAAALEARVNCVADPGHPRCAEFMDSKIREKEADRKLYEECLRVGESAFNRDRPDSQKRVYACAYSYLTHPVGGRAFRRLLPGACDGGAFVSPGGFDCCSADTVRSACSGDCNSYFK